MALQHRILVGGLDDVGPFDPGPRSPVGSVGMIEVVRAAACVACDVCVKVCPRDVFERGEDGVPVIARQSRLPDLLHVRGVLPDRRPLRLAAVRPRPAGSPHTDEAGLPAAGAFGEYRPDRLGRRPVPGFHRDPNYLFTAGLRAAANTPPEKTESTP